MVAGPVVGHLTGRLPYRRSQIVLTIVAAIASTWALVLLWPGRAPLPLLVLLVCVTGCGGPGSMVGFDLARSFHPSDRLGRASGVINIGGFFASLVTMALVGLILDARAPEGPGSYTLTDFKVAMSVQFLLWGLGAFQIWRYRYKGLEFVDEHPGRSRRCAPARPCSRASRATPTDLAVFARTTRVGHRSGRSLVL